MSRTLAATCVLVCFAVGSALAHDKSSGDEDDFETVRDRASYGIGVNIGRSLRQDGLDVDPEVLSLGIRDALARRKPRLSDKDFKVALTEFQKTMAKLKAERLTALAKKNSKEGTAFLKQNKSKPKVESLTGGLQYLVLQEGKGKSPKPDDRVTVHYRGRLIDGTEFDSSIERDEPATFSLEKVIEGWQKALPKMKVGDKWRLFVPPELAYGEKGSGEIIGPNAVLVFEIELLDCKKGVPEQATP